MGATRLARGIYHLFRVGLLYQYLWGCRGYVLTALNCKCTHQQKHRAQFRLEKALIRAWATRPPYSTDTQGILWISPVREILRSCMQHFPLKGTGESHTGYVLASQIALDASAWVSCPHSRYKITTLLLKAKKPRTAAKAKQHIQTPAHFA